MSQFEIVDAFRLPIYEKWTYSKDVSFLGSSDRAGLWLRAVGDLNRDGLDDLVLSYDDVMLPGPAILLSNGDGTFRRYSDLPNELNVRTLREVQVADINKDGYNDIIGFPASHGWREADLGPNWSALEYPLILIAKPDGGYDQVLFSDPSLLGFYHSGDIADINQDGLLDVFALVETSAPTSFYGGHLEKRALLQQPDGSFKPSSWSLPSVVTNYSNNNIEIGDVNGDGLNDYAINILSARFGYGPLGGNSDPERSSSWLRNKEPAIMFAFGEDGKSPEKLSWIPLGEHWIDEKRMQEFTEKSGQQFKSILPQVVEMFDLDGLAGKETLIIGYTVDFPSWNGASAIQVLQFNNGVFVDKTADFFPNQEGSKHKSGFLNEVYLADLNRDGALDFVTDTHGDLDILDYESPFSPFFYIADSGQYLPVLEDTFREYRYPIEGGNIGKPSEFAVGDFNGDGAPDLAALSVTLLKDSIGKWTSGEEAVLTYLNKYPNKTQVDLSGTPTDDILTLGLSRTTRGAAGNDKLLGEDSLIQTAFFYGGQDQYTIRAQGNTITVTDRTGSEGTDELNRIELLQFADETISIAQIAAKQNASAVFRFFNSSTGTHFYTGSAAEADHVVRTYDQFNFEGVAFDKNSPASGSALDVFRFYNTATGTHFYTGSVAEKNAVLANLPSFNYEGVAYQAHSTHSEGTTELYRFFNTSTGTHFYTANAAEMEQVKATLVGMNYEGVAYYVDA